MLFRSACHQPGGTATTGVSPYRPEQPGGEAEDSEGQDQFNSQLVLQEPVPKFLNSVKPAHAAEVYTFLKL